MKSEQVFEGVGWPVAVLPIIERVVEKKQALPDGLWVGAAVVQMGGIVTTVISPH